MQQENGRAPEAREDGTDLPNYRLIQLEWDARRGLFNDGVSDFEELVTHHPQSNRNATIQNGVVVGGEPGRRHGVVGGEIQEIEVATRQNTYGLGPDQVLLKKDFMLEDSRIASGGAGVRNVDVPSPIAGYVGNVYPAQGRVDILDREGGEVIARVRHMSNLQVERGDTIEYGQALGTQSNVATAAVHVHLEMDTRYYQQYENYIGDIASGRLAIDPARRTQGIEARPVVDDGVIRIGESSDRVRDAQRFLNEQGYRGRNNEPLAQDGVYRLDMQPAVLNFQAARGLAQTGDLDAATLALVPAPMRREADRADHFDRGVRPGGQVVPDGGREALPVAPSVPTAPGGPRDATDDRAPERPPGPYRPGAALLDSPTHPNHGMFAAALRAVNDRDAEMGRQPDEVSRQLAGGLVEKARERGLETIGAARFTPDGTKVGMTDTADLSSPWAKTAVGEVGQLAGQTLAKSSENVAAINQQQSLEQSLKQPTQTQTMQGPEDPTPKGPRMA